MTTIFLKTIIAQIGPLITVSEGVQGDYYDLVGPPPYRAYRYHRVDDACRDVHRIESHLDQH